MGKEKINKPKVEEVSEDSLTKGDDLKSDINDSKESKDMDEARAKVDSFNNKVDVEKSASNKSVVESSSKMGFLAFLNKFKAKPLPRKSKDQTNFLDKAKDENAKVKEISTKSNDVNLKEKGLSTKPKDENSKVKEASTKVIKEETSKDKKSFGAKFAEVLRTTLILLLVVFMTIVGFFAGWLAFEKYGGDLTNLWNNKPVKEKQGDGNEETPVVTVKEDEVVDVVQRSMQSVVSIAVGSYTLDKDQGVVGSNNNIGSGFIIDPAGLVLTNQHVVADMTADYVVVGPDNEEYEVTDIQRDDVNDIALLKIKVGEKSNLKALSLGDSSTLKVGQKVIAIGTPLGTYAGSVTTGVVSGLDRSVTTTSGAVFNITQKTFENVIQTDAAVNPGNSGGPLLDAVGNVIGINFATTTGADNISFAIPINFVKDRLDEYRKYGKFRHPSLGVSYEPISEYQARFYRNVVAGALVVGLEEDSPAAKAGVEKYDIIISLDGEEVTTSLRQLVLKHEVGETVKFKVWRDGEEIEMEVTLGEAE